jgi:hypothetical protein
MRSGYNGYVHMSELLWDLYGVHAPFSYHFSGLAIDN